MRTWRGCAPRIAGGGFFEARIGRYFLDNPHRVRFVLAPDPQMAAREAAREAAELAERRAALTDTEAEAVRADAAALARRQDVEEDVSCLHDLGPVRNPAPRAGQVFPRTATGARRPCAIRSPRSGIVYLSAVAGIGRVAGRSAPPDSLLLLRRFAGRHTAARLRRHGPAHRHLHRGGGAVRPGAHAL